MDPGADRGEPGRRGVTCTGLRFLKAHGHPHRQTNSGGLEGWRSSARWEFSTAETTALYWVRDYQRGQESRTMKSPTERMREHTAGRPIRLIGSPRHLSTSEWVNGLAAATS